MTYSLYNGIIKPLRDEDAKNGELLRRFLLGPQAEFDRTREGILSLYDQVKPDKIRADLLDYLLPLVGFTAQLRSITDRLSEAQKRKLVALAVPMWNERHTVKGLINAIRLLTGRAAFVSTWFTYRQLIGEVTLTEDQLTTGGDFWIIGGETSNYDEYWSNIRLMDDGTLDELLLLDIVKLMRPLGERFEVFLDDFLDRFDSELDKWEFPTGTDPEIVDGYMAVPDGTVVKPIIPLITDQTDNFDYNLVTKFRLTAGAQLITRWYADQDSFATGGTCFEFKIQSGSPRLEYNQYHNNVIVNSLSFDGPLVIAEDTWYKLRISTVNNGLDREHRILVDGNLLMFTGVLNKYIDTVNGDGTPGFGYYLWKANGAEVHLDNVESWRNPGRFATVEIGTPSEPGGAVTMTDNFVLE